MDRTSQNLSSPRPKPKRDHYSSSVDTSRPFRSVKEVVAIFGERILVGEIHNSPKPYYTPPSQEPYSWRYPLPSPSQSYNDPKEDNDENEVLGTLKKLEAELEETKAELKMLKERESETEIALASLNTELHKNMSKLAEAEAIAAKRAVEARIESDRKEIAMREHERRKEKLFRMEDSPTLAEILSLGEERGFFGSKKERKLVKKKKPIVPLLGDFFFLKRGSNRTRSLYAGSHSFFN